MRPPKRDQIVTAGRDLLMKYGLKRITVDEICRSAGVSKMTFYNHFPNKAALAETILVGLIDEATAAYAGIRAMDASYEEKARAILEMKLKFGRAASLEFVRDLFDARGSAMRTLLLARKDENLRLFLEDIARAQASGEVRADIRPAMIAYVLDRMIEWLSDPRLLGMFPTAEALTAEILNFFFYGLLARPAGKSGAGEGGSLS